MIKLMLETFKKVHDKVTFKYFTYYSAVVYIFVMLIGKFLPRYISGPIIAIAYVGFLYVIARILMDTLNLYRRLKNFEFIKMDNFEEDSNRRKELFKNIMIILIGLSFMITPIVSIMKLSEKMQIELINYYFLFIATTFVLYLIQKFRGQVITTLMILSSTILGFFILIIVLLTTLTAGIMLLELFNTGATSFYSSYNQIFVSLSILTLFIAKDFIYFWINLGIAILVQCIIIVIRPSYMVTSTKFAFKAVSVIFTAVTVILLFFSKESFQVYIRYAQSLLKDISNTNDFIKYLGSTEAIYTQEYFDKVIKGISIPYTLGSLIGLYLLDIKENKNNNKAHKYFLRTLLLIEQNKPGEEVLALLKKTIYYGGNSYVNTILCSTKFEPYLADMQYQKLFEAVENKKFKAKVRKLLLDIKDKHNL